MSKLELVRDFIAALIICKEVNEYDQKRPQWNQWIINNRITALVAYATGVGGGGGA